MLMICIEASILLAGFALSLYSGRGTSRCFFFLFAYFTCTAYRRREMTLGTGYLPLAARDGNGSGPAFLSYLSVGLF